MYDDRWAVFLGSVPLRGDVGPPVRKQLLQQRLQTLQNRRETSFPTIAHTQWSDTYSTLWMPKQRITQNTDLLTSQDVEHLRRMRTGAVGTSARLCRLGIRRHPSCVLCGAPCEDDHHLLWECPETNGNQAVVIAAFDSENLRLTSSTSLPWNFRAVLQRCPSETRLRALVPSSLVFDVQDAFGGKEATAWLKRFVECLVAMMSTTMRLRQQLLQSRGLQVADGIGQARIPRAAIALPVSTECTALVAPTWMPEPEENLHWPWSPLALPPLWTWLRATRWCWSPVKYADTPWYVLLLAFESENQAFWPVTTSPIQDATLESLSHRTRSFTLAVSHLLHVLGLHLTPRERTLRGSAWGCPARAGVREFLWIPQSDHFQRATTALQLYNSRRRSAIQISRVQPSARHRPSAVWGSDAIIVEHVTEPGGNRLGWPLTPPALHPRTQERMAREALSGVLLPVDEAAHGPLHARCSLHNHRRCEKCLAAATLTLRDGQLDDCCILHHPNVPTCSRSEALEATRDFLTSCCRRAQTGRGVSLGRILLQLTRWMRRRGLGPDGCLFTGLRDFDAVVSTSFLDTVLGQKPIPTRVLSEMEKARRRHYAARGRGQSAPPRARSAAEAGSRRSTSSSGRPPASWRNTGADGIPYVTLSIIPDSDFEQPRDRRSDSSVSAVT